MLERFDWEVIPPPAAQDFVEQTLNLLGQPPAAGATIVGHVATLSCYPALRLLHLSLARPDQPVRTLFALAGDGEVTVLTGESAPIHQLNASLDLSLDESTAPDYLRFFCFAVRGEEGPFVILEPPRDPPPDTVPARPEIHEALAKHARPLEALGSGEDGRWRYRAVVAYGQTLARASFAVTANGLIEMLEDDPITDEAALAALPSWPPLIGPASSASPEEPERQAGPVGGTVLRVLVELLLEDALANESGHRLLAHFNRTQSNRQALDGFADLVASASPVVVIESTIPFVEEIVAELLEARLPESRRLRKSRSDVDVNVDTRLRPNVPVRSPALLVLSFHAYRSVADVERVSYELTSRDVAALIGCGTLGDVPEPLRRIADLVLELPPISPALFQTLFTRITGHPLPADWQDGGTHWVRQILHSDLEQPQGLALEPDDALAFIRDRVEERMRAVDPADSLGLADLHGLGEAREFAEDLIADIHDAIAGRVDWRDVDRGVLLAGPPGTGKTTLARAIARDCRVKFVSSSAASWQAAGHLGDYIRSMRSDFAQARRYAPAILFIDEIDSVGSREHFSGHNAQYHIEVVNALLEQMQGMDPAAPVIVIAATNHADRVDPALRRAGRLDRVIDIPYPNIEALGHIFEYYLERYRATVTVADDVDVRTLGGLTFGMTGADVERIVRGAARRGRKAGRPITQRDLLEEVLGMPRDRDTVPRLGPEEVRRVATHEAGHALAACLDSSGGREVTWVSIVPRADGSLGFVARVPTGRRIITRAEMIERIEVMLAGRAAEEILFGEDGVSGGAGGPSPHSDLAAATATALQLVAQTGLAPNGSLLWSPEPGARHAEQAEQILREAYIAVRSRLIAHRDTLNAIAEALHRTQELTGEEVRRLVAQSRAVVAEPRS